jgi:hypothetical protein
MEKLQFDENSANTDTDFVLQELKYTPSRNGFSGNEITQTYNGYSDVEDFYLNASDYSSNVLITGSQNQIIDLEDPDGTGLWTTVENTFSCDPLSAATSYFLKSNDIEVISTGDGGDLNCVLTLTITAGNLLTKQCYLTDRVSGATVSDVITLTAGVNTFTLKPTVGNYDSVLTIKFIGTAGTTCTGWVTCADNKYRHRVHWEAGAISGTQKDNGPFSQANIINNWWSIYRPTNSGTQNGVAKTFTNSQFIIKRQCKARYWPDDINMQFGINDGTHIAKIGRYERDLDSDFVTFELLYQEYE